MTPEEQCRLHIAPLYSDWDFALRRLNPIRATPLLGLLSFVHRINDISHRASEKAVALTQLQWWRSQLDARANADFDELNTSQHPSLSAMAEHISRSFVNQRLHRLLDLAVDDVEFSGFAARTDMQRFFRTRGALTLELFAELNDSSITAELSGNLGYFLEYCDLLQHFAHFSQSGVVYFSNEDLMAHQWTAEKIIEKNAEQNTANWLTFFREQTQLATESFEADIAKLNPSLASLKRYLNLRFSWLKTTAKHGFPLYRYQIQLGTLQKHVICLQSDWF